MVDAIAGRVGSVDAIAQVLLLFRSRWKHSPWWMARCFRVGSLGWVRMRSLLGIGANLNGKIIQQTLRYLPFFSPRFDSITCLSRCLFYRFNMNIGSAILRLCGHPLLGKMFLLGLAFLILSFAVYFWQRLTGALPDEVEWFRHGILGPNHGPWHLKLESLLVLWPYLFLIPSTLVTSVVFAVGKRRPLLLVHGFGISFVLALMAVFQLWYLGWTID